MNDDFYKEAFTSAEQGAINKTTLSNENKPFYETEGGNSTTDFVYLLSLSDIVNKSYGFPTSYWCYSASRQAVPTNGGVMRWWWLRSPGSDSDSAAAVNDDGYVGYDGFDVYYYNFGVRPALHLNLSSPVWTKGEEVTSENKKTADVDSFPGEETDSGGNDGGESDAGNPPQPGKTPLPTGSEASGASAAPNANTSPATSSNPTNSSTPSVNGSAAGETSVGIKVSGSNSSADTVTAPGKVKSLKVTYTIKSLKKKTTYYFRVRAYKNVSGKKKYGKWSAVKKIKIRK